MNKTKEAFSTRIWNETPEPDNPFAAAACYCHGYDVYGEILGNGSWTEYLYLIFFGERPTVLQTKLLDGLAVCLAHPGIREPSVHAAMSGGAGGSTGAACLMAALAVGAGQLGGGHEIFRSIECWQECGQNLATWREYLPRFIENDEPIETWLPMEHPPGFDPHGASCATPVRQALRYLAHLMPGGNASWLEGQRTALEEIANMPLSMSGVAAATFMDLGATPQQAEMLYLILRLPGAAAHALEQHEQGWRRFPTFANAIVLKNDPGPYPNGNHDKDRT